jgi:alpha-L-fucosidase 2
LLEKALGDNYSVLNFGRSATNAQRSADFPYWIAKEFSNVFACQPNIIVIKLGTNDTKPQNWNQENYKKDYQALIDTFNTIASNPKIYICKPVPVYQTKWGINDSTVNYGVIPVLEQLASDNNLEIIDLNAALSDKPELFPDFIHPNEAGVKIIADVIAKSILETRQ